MSKLIRAGLLPRKEALEALKLNYSEDLLNKVKEELGIKEEKKEN